MSDEVRERRRCTGVGSSGEEEEAFGGCGVEASRKSGSQARERLREMLICARKSGSKAQQEGRRDYVLILIKCRGLFGKF
jgi:hypothetical protein